MLTYSMAEAGSESLYHFLYKCIKNDILSGKLSSDERLPSKRTFAKNLGVSVITVENAYSQLLAEGYIYSLAKKGFYVSAINNAKNAAPKKLSKAFKVTEIESEPDKDLIDLVSNNYTRDNFPFYSWSKIARQVLLQNQEELLTLAEPTGMLRVRKSIARALSEFRNMDVSPDQIIIGAGTDHLYNVLARCFGRKKIAVEDPGYNKISKIYQNNGTECSFIPLDSNGIIMEELEKSGAEVMHISPAHHFPTGIVTPASKRYELLSWANKSEDRFIVEDDYDTEFRMTGLPIPALQTIDSQDKVVYMNSFSKSLTQTLRLCYMVIPLKLVKQFDANFLGYSCAVSNLTQIVLSRFIDEGYFEKHINRMRNVYRARRDMVLKAVQKKIPPEYVTIHEKDSGLHFVIEVKTNLTDKEFCEIALQKGVKVKALSEYYFKAKPSEHRFVVNYTSLRESQINAATEALYDIIMGR